MKEGIGHELKNDNRKMVEVKKVVEKFYKELYAKRDTDEDSKEKWIGKIKRNIGVNNRSKLEKEISVEEIRDAVSEHNNSKAPGSDGLVVELYKKIPLMSKWLLQAWKE